MYKDIKSMQDMSVANGEQMATLFYFSHEACNVCKVLKPKIAELIQQRFPEIKLFYADTQKYPEIAAQHSVFTVPTILVFFDGRETYRKSRNIGVDELASLLERPYSLIFGD